MIEVEKMQIAGFTERVGHDTMRLISENMLTAANQIVEVRYGSR